MSAGIRLLLAVLAVSAALAPLPSSAATLIHAGRVIDGVSERVLSERTLVIDGGRIVAISSQMRRTANGASSALFTTTVLPATSAGAIFSAISIIGTFHGMMAPTTPIGSRIVMVSMSGLKGTVSPFNSLPRPA
jgi:hypothetical protein